MSISSIEEIDRLSRQMIKVKALLRDVSQQTAHLLPCLTAVGDCEELKPNVLQIHLGCHREKVAEALLQIEQANATLCTLHLNLNSDAESRGIELATTTRDPAGRTR